MFRGFAKDLAGTADICNTVTNVTKIQGATYLLPGEEILFAFASAKEEFVFTNEALLTVHGENAMTTRKLVLRYEYRDHRITHVQFETTGRVDRDCEIKFRIGEFDMSIDIAKKEEELVKQHYKTLVTLSREQEKRAHNWSFAREALDKSSDAMKINGYSDPTLNLTNHASGTLEWLEADFNRLNPRSYHAEIQAALASTGGLNAPSHRRSIV
uniref:Bacterial Pleckstrin homology domain-containing protein n=1 Tax=Globisporangium ultimum (strain ATCC 200006 / CBS 805.95 / DAOM BR144) TaxID=431595 RepID=K3X6T7_GLOUD